MNIEKWQDVMDQIRANFEVVDTGKEVDEESGAETEFIEFISPMGRMFLEFTSRPVILETHTKYKKRIGADIEVENVYSDTEKSNTLEVWKWDEALDDWTEFKSTMFQ